MRRVGSNVDLLAIKKTTATRLGETRKEEEEEEEYEENKNIECDSRESNPGQRLGKPP